MAVPTLYFEDTNWETGARSSPAWSIGVLKVDTDSSEDTRYISHNCPNDDITSVALYITGTDAAEIADWATGSGYGVSVAEASGTGAADWGAYAGIYSTTRTGAGAYNLQYGNVDPQNGASTAAGIKRYSTTVPEGQSRQKYKIKIPAAETAGSRSFNITAAFDYTEEAP